MIFVAIIITMFAFGYLSLWISNGLTAYIKAESLWTKGQKDAVLSLYRFAHFHDEQDFVRFENAIKVPIGDHQARVAILQRSPPDIERAAKGWLQGKNDLHDISYLTILLRYFHSFPYFKEAVHNWRQGDLKIEELRLLAGQLHEVVHRNDVTQKAELHKLLEKLTKLNDEVTEFEDVFTLSLKEGMNQIKDIFNTISVILLIAFVTIGFYIFHTSRNIIRVINESINNEREALQKVAQTAKNANEAKSEFLANMSHEIRTPLNAVTGFSELLSSLVTDKKQKSYLEAIKTSGKNLLMLINDILDLSKIEAGQLDIHVSAVDVRGLLRDIEQIFALQASQKGIRFIININHDLPHILLLDEVRLRQILLNIVGNAVKFTEKGSIGLSVTALERTPPSVFDIYFTIEDTGIGIPEKEIDAIFDSFRQPAGQNGKRYGGTGLGLSICKRLVEMMNGRITVESTEGKGTVFTIKIGDVSSKTGGDTTYHETIHHGGIRFELGKVLVVDDVESNRYFMSELLRSLNLIVLESQNGQEALLLIPEFQPDVILMDICMPVLDGYKTLKKLKQDRKTEHIPVIAVTASSSNEKKTDIQNKGFDGVLLKPVEVHGLLRELSKYLIVSNENLLEGSRYVTTEPLSNCPELIRILDSDFRPRRDRLQTRQPMDEVKAFGNDLKKLGLDTGNDVLVRYGDQLVGYVDNFDVGGIRAALNEFSIFLPTLTDA